MRRLSCSGIQFLRKGLVQLYRAVQVLGGAAGTSAAGSGGANTRSVPNVPLREAVADYERGLIRQALQEAKGNIDRAAALLQIPRTTLYSRMSKLGLR